MTKQTCATSDCPIESKINELGFSLPDAPNPVASYLPAVQVGNLLYISGQIPIKHGTMIAQGSIPDQVDMQTAHQCAVQCTLNALAVAKATLGSLCNIKRVIRVGGFVACSPGFADQPKIINSCSDLLVEIFSDNGKHARAAVGSVSLPLNAPVEIEFLLEIKG